MSIKTSLSKTETIFCLTSNIIATLKDNNVLNKEQKGLSKPFNISNLLKKI